MLLLEPFRGTILRTQPTVIFTAYALFTAVRIDTVPAKHPWLSPCCLSFLCISLCLFFFLVPETPAPFSRQPYHTSYIKAENAFCVFHVVLTFLSHIANWELAPLRLWIGLANFANFNQTGHTHICIQYGRVCFSTRFGFGQIWIACVCVRWGKQKGLEGGGRELNRPLPLSAFHSFRGALLPSWLTLRHPSHRSSGLLIYRSSTFLE